jgi:hypothetical protein
MKDLKIIGGVFLVVLMVLLFSSGPQQHGPKYDAATEVKIAGTVQGVQQYWCPISRDEGVHLMVQTDAGMVPVHLAPLRYLAGHGVSYDPGQRVEVVGSKVVFEGQDAIIARKITRGDQTMAFRQPDGRPLWIEQFGRYVR